VTRAPVDVVELQAGDLPTARRRTRGCFDRPRYDLWSVSSHEIGHVVGLGDLTGDGELYQTMYDEFQECDFTWRQLGRGDYIGLTRLYTAMPPP